MPYSYYTRVFKDLEDYGWDRVESVSDSLQTVLLSISDSANRRHEVQVTLPPTYPQGSPQCQLALPESYAFQWGPVNSIPTIHNTIVSVLEKYSDIWTVLMDFDSHCLVLDPSNPTFSQNYRRVFLGMSGYAFSLLEKQCSLLYSVNMEKPWSIGEWRFMGPPTQTDRFDQLMSRNIGKW